MPIDAPFGGEPKDSAPPWFSFENYASANMMGVLPRVDPVVLFGLPTTPINTAEFCTAAPPSELPTLADYAGLAFPLVAAATGVYQRFGNQVRNDAWAALCNAKPDPSAPPAPIPEPPPGSICGPEPATYGVVWVHAIPAGTFEVHLTNKHRYVDGVEQSWPSNSFRVAWGLNAPTVGGNPFPRDAWLNWNPAPADFTISWTGYHESAPAGYFWIYNEVAGWDSHTCVTFDLAFTPLEAPSEPVTAPPLVGPPADWPSFNVSVCDSFDDVCANLNELAKLIAALAERIRALEQSKTDAVRATVVHEPLTGTGTVTTGAQLWGVGVHCTEIPNRLGRNETDVVEYGSLGTLSFETPWGWTRPQRIRHADTVFDQLPAFVSGVNYDLELGVVAQLVELVRSV